MNAPMLSNGLALSFVELSFDAGELQNYVAIIGHTLKVSMMELFEIAPKMEKEVSAIAHEIANDEAKAEARTLAEVRDWLNSRR